MYKSIKTLLLIAVIAIGTNITVQAQKFGYIDSQSLLVAHPDVKTADTQIKTFSDQLIAKGQNMVKAFEDKYSAFAKEAQAGTLSQLQIQEKEGILGQEQQKIQKFEVDMQQKIAAEREKLYSPILDKVKSTIEAIGKEDGYTMIFDTSTGSLVYATPSEDLMAKVKARLGIQ